MSKVPYIDRLMFLIDWASIFGISLSDPTRSVFILRVLMNIDAVWVFFLFMIFWCLTWFWLFYLSGCNKLSFGFCATICIILKIFYLLSIAFNRPEFSQYPNVVSTCEKVVEKFVGDDPSSEIALHVITFNALNSFSNFRFVKFWMIFTFEIRANPFFSIEFRTKLTVY